MYQPRKYKKDELAFAKKLIQDNPFASLVLQGNKLLATHVPVLIDEDKDDFFLYSHIANHNPQREFLTDKTEVLLIFQGANAYISSSWYKEKDISTWDYSAVHVNAEIILQTPHELIKSLKKLIIHFEKNQEKPLYYKDIPSEILAENLPHITGFWCKPTAVKGIGKWHQSFQKEDVKNIVQQLQQKACPAEKALIKDIKKAHDL